MMNKIMDWIVWNFMPRNNGNFACAVRAYFMRKLDKNKYYPPNSYDDED